MLSLFSKFSDAVKKTSSKISQGISDIVTKRKLDEEVLEELEEILLGADVSISTSNKLIDKLRQEKFDKEVSSQELKEFLAAEIRSLLNDYCGEIQLQSGKLTIVLVCGVNGNGKTTILGKLANYYKSQGLKVALAACDTFRAAAIDQLKVWSDRSKVEFFAGNEKQDPASVAYSAVEKYTKEQYDILFVDTAGRLQNKKNLMDELAKIINVIKKLDSSAPHECLLTLDATTGQNAILQAEEFTKVAPISGIVINKLDGTAKAGSVLTIVSKFKLPIYYVGIGEKIEDIITFSPNDFAAALVGLKNI